MGEYRVILADPPWQYGCFPPGKKVRRENRRNVSPAAVQYQTLTLDALCQVHIDDWASNDAALFMWATMPCLPEAFDLMRAWDFTYKTVAFTWVKRNHDGSPFKGLGHYTRSNAEVCLLGIRGRMERKARDVAQVILSPRREHSRKPDEQYERIMRLFDGPYLELFARQRWPGWDVWGNETDRFEAEASSYAEAEAMTLKAVYACDGCGRGGGHGGGG